MGFLPGKKKSKKNKKTKSRAELDWLDFDEDDEYEDEEYDEDDDEYEDEEYDEDDDEYEDEEYDDEEDTDEYEEEDDIEDADEYDDEDDEDAEEYDDEDDEDAEEYDDEDDEDADEYDEDEDDEDADEYDEDDEYDDDEAYDDEEEPTGIKRVANFFMNMSMVDHIIMFTGLMVLVLAGFTGFMYVDAKISEKQIATFAEVGTGMEDISVIGEEGLLAIADAQAAKVYAAELEEIEKEATVVDEETGKIEVVMNLTSIQKDLKIKFTNKKSGKLIPNVAFEVEVTKPSGKTYTLKDEDKDGIIYEKEIEPGKYKVAIVGPEDLEEYSFSKEATAITVRDTIEYKKVDIANEVKSEAQVNAAVEDTKVNETVVESENKDTVEWVESTKTLIEGTESTSDSYEKVDKKNIVDPSAKAAAGFRLLTEVNPTSPPVDVPETEPTAEPTQEPVETPAATPTEEPASTPEATQAPAETPTTVPTAAPTVTPAPAATPAVTPTPMATVTPTATPSPAATPSATATPTPSATASATPSTTPTATPTPSATASATPSTTPTATPKNDVKNDTTSNLKTKDGEKLYVKDGNGNFREAKYADYFNSEIGTFYRKIAKTTGEYRYTGWQTIDGATYFFDKNGNKVTGEQVIQGAKYTFNANGVLDNGSGNLGIDVSKWNGSIDWNAVKNSGVSYVIIRCGYRGSTTGALIEDPTFHKNIKGAQSAGLKVGVYFFSQATNEVEAVEEASMALSLVKGYNLSYPIFLDVEASGGRADGISSGSRTAVCKAFCQTIQNSGYKAGIYANKTWFNEYMDTPSLTGYKLWLAQYAATPTYTRTKYDMWQYSSKGRVSGISGNVDMNISYLGY